MKTIGFKDNAGGLIHLYFNKSKKETRWERFYNALNELKHTANITIYRIKGNKVKKLKRKGF